MLCDGTVLNFPAVVMMDQFFVIYLRRRFLSFQRPALRKAELRLLEVSYFFLFDFAFSITPEG